MTWYMTTVVVAVRFGRVVDVVFVTFVISRQWRLVSKIRICDGKCY